MGGLQKLSGCRPQVFVDVVLRVGEGAVLVLSVGHEHHLVPGEIRVSGHEGHGVEGVVPTPDVGHVIFAHEDGGAAEMTTGMHGGGPEHPGGAAAGCLEVGGGGGDALEKTGEVFAYLPFAGVEGAEVAGGPGTGVEVKGNLPDAVAAGDEAGAHAVALLSPPVGGGLKGSGEGVEKHFAVTGAGVDFPHVPAHGIHAGAGAVWKVQVQAAAGSAEADGGVGIEDDLDLSVAFRRAKGQFGLVPFAEGLGAVDEQLGEGGGIKAGAVALSEIQAPHALVGRGVFVHAAEDHVTAAAGEAFEP